MNYSNIWRRWVTIVDGHTCVDCIKNNGKILDNNEKDILGPPQHKNCRCITQRLQSIFAGEATKRKQNGADWYLKYKSKLPDYYISLDDAIKLGYKSWLGNLGVVAPGKMIFKGIFKNLNNHLPSNQNRIWYEADINYTSGYRNDERIIFSNDGLIFVTYDHYKTFVEIR